MAGGIAAASLIAALGHSSALVAAEPAPATAATTGVQVIVAKATNACFSDMVRVTGFIVPRREAQVGVDQEGSRVTDLLVREGDTVTFHLHGTLDAKELGSKAGKALLALIK